MVKRFLGYYFNAKTVYNVHSPFLYNIINSCISSNKRFPLWQSIEELRIALLNNHKKLAVKDLGAGSKKGNSSERTISSIAKSAVSANTQLEIIARLVNQVKANNILELGTSLGISSAYLSSGIKPNIITIEGSSEIADLARSNFETLGLKNIEVINAPFDDCYEEILKNNPAFDIIFIDGNHKYDATVKYFEIAMKHVNQSSILIFDDIYWSEGMESAWTQIISDDRVSFSIDLFYFGIVFLDSKEGEKQNIKYIPWKYKPWKIGLWG